LRSCNWNKDNPNKVRGKEVLFYEYNPEKVADELLKNENLEVEARYMAKHMDFEELKNIARALNVNINRSTSEVRHDMMVIAKNKPQLVMNALDNPNTQRKVEVLEAIELGLLRTTPREVFFKDALEDKSVLTVPVSIDPVEHFTEWTLTTKDGEEFFDVILKKRKKMLE
jgi:hypothetical protein